VSFRAALTQTCNAYEPMPRAVSDLEALAQRLEDVRRVNLEHHVQLIEAAQAAGARLVGLGELFAAPYFCLQRNALWRELAEPAADGPTVRVMREVARRLSLVLVVPIYEVAPAGRFNTAVVIDSDGSLVGGYRKCHIPVGRNELGEFDEAYYYGPADGSPIPGLPAASDPYLPVFETAACRLGVSICYDRHFEGVVRALARGGAELVLSPAVTFGAQSERVWELEFAVDAARQRVFIGGSNRAGSEAPWNQEYFGRSHFVGPEGKLEDLSDDPRLVIAELDTSQLAGPSASGWDLDRDRREEIY
jgi:beta-ureidopropionase